MIHRKELQCPRRAENPMSANMFPGPDVIREDGTCSYCGSLDANIFMTRLEARDIEIGPTDKSYKAYLRNRGGAPLLQTYRACPPDSGCTGPKACTHWTTRESDQGKLYFQHLSEDQQRRFIELYNERHLHIGQPGHFYTTPFFCQR